MGIRMRGRGLLWRVRRRRVVRGVAARACAGARSFTPFFAFGVSAGTWHGSNRICIPGHASTTSSAKVMLVRAKCSRVSVVVASGAHDLRERSGSFSSVTFLIRSRNIASACTAEHAVRAATGNANGGLYDHARANDRRPDSIMTSMSNKEGV